MKSTKPAFDQLTTGQSNEAVPSGTRTTQCKPTPSAPAHIRTTAREDVNPVEYRHPYESLCRFANARALRYAAKSHPPRLLLHVPCDRQPYDISRRWLFTADSADETDIAVNRKPPRRPGLLYPRIPIHLRSFAVFENPFFVGYRTGVPRGRVRSPDTKQEH